MQNKIEKYRSYITNILADKSQDTSNDVNITKSQECDNKNIFEL